MRRELFSFGRIARVVLLACGFVWLDLYGMTPPRDTASLTCLAVGQLAGLIAVFIPDVQPVENSQSNEESEDDVEAIVPG